VKQKGQGAIAQKEEEQYMLRTVSCITAALLLSAITGCAVLHQNERPSAEPRLDMQTWAWIHTQYNNDTTVTPANPGVFTLTFNGDGTVNATTDCNRLFGNYHVDGRKISFSKLAATKMHCPDSQEHDFANMLSQVTSFLFTPDARLVLEFKYDSGQMIFE
jgi:heat shock protein HslJ